MLFFLKHHKFLAAFLATLILIIALLPFASIRPIYNKDELSYGVSFSPRLVRGMGLNWQAAYLAVLDELYVRKLRLMAYWDETENKEGVFNFDDLDWQINEADRRSAKVILAVGARLPRWPECHFPDWAENLVEQKKEQATMKYIQQVVERYRNQENIIAWQVENEPFLPHFGECPPLDKTFLDKEIALVRSLDERPIIITDSGELSFWVPAAERADIFGTSIYRNTYSYHFQSYIHYPLAPWFFRLKANLTEFFSMPKPSDMIVIELQAEPWGPTAYYQLTKDERERTMDVEKFKDILEFARRSGFQEFYLWGAEYWYWEKEVNGDSGMWEEAKTLFK